MRQHRDARLKKGKDNLLINTTKSAEGGPSFSAVPLLRTLPQVPDESAIADVQMFGLRVHNL